MQDLELILEGTFIELGVLPKRKAELLGILKLIKEKDYATYEHSIRVARLAVDIAKLLGLEPKPMFYGGLTHDVGKVNQDNELLTKKGNFDEKDREKMRSHPLDAYHFLKNVFKYTAEIVVRHHIGQKDQYPVFLPPECKDYPLNKRITMGFYARLLAIADFYDAITKRKNEKYGEIELTPQQKKQILLDNYPDHKDLIEKFYEKGIFKL